MPQTSKSALEQRSLFAFSLGREWKLSLAELFSIFGEKSYHSHSELIAIFRLSDNENNIITKFRKIGGSIRMMKILSETDAKKFPTDVIHTILETRDSKLEGTRGSQSDKSRESRKIHFALGTYGETLEQSHVGLRIKKTLIESGFSVRLVNTENKNINAASWKKEKLGKLQTEYNLLKIGEKSYLAVTLACQDVDAYAKRDTDKSRDMIVGMMPPKLCQMMINLATSSFETRNSKLDENRVTIYDPFCGLGTFLIEAANMGYTKIYGSDISPRMVTSSKASLEKFIEEETLWQDRIRKVGGTPSKDFRKLEFSIFEQDAEMIGSLKQNNFLDNAIIVSEGYLGEMMSKEKVNLERVKEERRKLSKMYEGYFSGLKKLKFTGNIVMSFPFWSIDENFIYFSEIYEIIEKYGLQILPLLPREMNQNTMKGSLLYRRPGQTVGREIIKIQKK